MVIGNLQLVIRQSDGNIDFFYLSYFKLFFVCLFVCKKAQYSEIVQCSIVQCIAQCDIFNVDILITLIKLIFHNRFCDRWYPFPVLNCFHHQWHYCQGYNLSSDLISYFRHHYHYYKNLYCWFIQFAFLPLHFDVKYYF